MKKTKMKEGVHANIENRLVSVKFFICIKICLVVGFANYSLLMPTSNRVVP